MRCHWVWAFVVGVEVNLVTEKKWDGEERVRIHLPSIIRSKMVPSTPVRQQKGTEAREVAASLIFHRCPHR